jgi:hypothetical protein
LAATLYFAIDSIDVQHAIRKEINHVRTEALHAIGTINTHLADATSRTVLLEVKLDLHKLDHVSQMKITSSPTPTSGIVAPLLDKTTTATATTCCTRIPEWKNTQSPITAHTLDVMAAEGDVVVEGLRIFSFTRFIVLACYLLGVLVYSIFYFVQRARTKKENHVELAALPAVPV